MGSRWALNRAMSLAVQLKNAGDAVRVWTSYTPSDRDVTAFNKVAGLLLRATGTHSITSLAKLLSKVEIEAPRAFETTTLLALKVKLRQWEDVDALVASNRDAKFQHAMLDALLSFRAPHPKDVDVRVRSAVSALSLVSRSAMSERVLEPGKDLNSAPESERETKREGVDAQTLVTLLKHPHAAPIPAEAIVSLLVDPATHLDAKQVTVALSSLNRQREWDLVERLFIERGDANHARTVQLSSLLRQDRLADAAQFASGSHRRSAVLWTAYISDFARRGLVTKVDSLLHALRLEVASGAVSGVSCAPFAGTDPTSEDVPASVGHGLEHARSPEYSASSQPHSISQQMHGLHHLGCALLDMHAAAGDIPRWTAVAAEFLPDPHDSRTRVLILQSHVKLLCVTNSHSLAVKALLDAPHADGSHWGQLFNALFRLKRYAEITNTWNGHLARRLPLATPYLNPLEFYLLATLHSPSPPPPEFFSIFDSAFDNLEPPFAYYLKTHVNIFITILARRPLPLALADHSPVPELYITKLMDMGVSPQTDTLNVLLEYYFRHNQPDIAMSYFEQMQKVGHRIKSFKDTPSSRPILTVISESNIGWDDITLCTVIDGLGHLGRMSQIKDLMTRIRQRNICRNAWCSYFEAMSRNRNFDEALVVLSTMDRKKLSRKLVTNFIGISKNRLEYAAWVDLQGRFYKIIGNIAELPSE